MQRLVVYNILAEVLSQHIRSRRGHYLILIHEVARVTQYHAQQLYLVARLSGNALVSINVVTLRRARLVLGWVTVCERVNHLGM